MRRKKGRLLAEELSGFKGKLITKPDQQYFYPTNFSWKSAIGKQHSIIKGLSENTAFWISRETDHVNIENESARFHSLQSYDYISTLGKLKSYRRSQLQNAVLSLV
jgi:hypothetical protein